MTETSLSDDLREAASASWLPWLASRAIVLLSVAMGKYELSHFHITDRKAVTEAHAGLLGSDAGWYESIAAHGYHAAGQSSLRFFPLLPVSARLLHDVLFLPVGGALLVISNVCAFALTMGIYFLTKSEFGDSGPARSAAWLINLAPASFTLVMGYSDALLILLAVAAFICLRRHHWLLAAAAGYLAGTARPLGFLLFVPALVEASSGLWTTQRSEQVSRLASVLAPVAGLLTYLVWVDAEFGSFTRPLTLQTQSSRHGGLTDPVVTLYHDALDLVGGHHIGTDLHLPWVLLAAVLVVVVFRTLPLSYGLYTSAVLLVAVSGSNLDSFERYALGAFPLIMGGALLVRSRRVETTVLVVGAACLFGYSLLAFLGAYVP
ncbi:MAG: hypothetical protein ABSF84_15785 [Acidimicrobiales bacterium]